MQGCERGRQEGIGEQLERAIRALEAVDWSGVESVNNETAAVFTSRLVEARGHYDGA